MSGTLRLILGDQLSRSISSLTDINVAEDTVLMVEVMAEATYVRHHKKKIAFLFSAMRHFAEELREEGLRLVYVKLDDPGNTMSFTGEVKRHVDLLRPERLVVTEPGEWRILEMMRLWQEELDVPVEVREDTRFLCSTERFADWAKDRKALRMEYFYREMRREHQILLQGEDPEGGQWNFDHDNREALPDKIDVPDHPIFSPDAITSEVIELVAARFPKHFGALDGFDMPVTRADALSALEQFIDERLPRFGQYQDAMKADEPKLFHSNISAALNCGMLLPLEVIKRAEMAYHMGTATLNCVEGFIRQILGWREYVRGIYWLKMPDYAQTNALNAHRPLPEFYWTGKTDMNCMRHVIEETKQNAHAHHIQRLMVTGNFALLAGIEPAQIEAWYLAVYADAYEWVELPNTHGMVCYADGGLLASKPYAASGAYIDKMSDYCGNCRYKVKLKAGPDACPFNYLYWNLLIENESTLRRNQRMSVIISNIGRMSTERKQEIISDSKQFLDALTPWDPNK
ncbi:MAG: cryptochrome/photolyase family protein [Rhizobiaceae bacterium]